VRRGSIRGDQAQPYRDSGADQNDVARAFGRSPRTLRRYERRVEAGGLAALGRPQGYPAGRARLKASRVRPVAHLKADGLSNRAVAHRIGVSENAVRKLLRRVGWRPSTSEQERLPLAPLPAHPNLSAFSPPPFAAAASPAPAPEEPPAEGGPHAPALDDVPVSFDRDPADRITA
jgi:transposase